ncbi:hypothetical protein LZZ85_26590 [Terrimonas sp. NA20]|uniref:Lipocalin-like domain-containing protein n=1 Tax=Terrimonas ginsenosidimutans TaxID=2908004 RepID=A0ABS9L003_9BACT|nr:hypothetical protein [Terrimonas ginsenosidimutans]MCG2617898.1 hypothetical protein [Terrimonas ginsenosidimutans]
MKKHLLSFALLTAMFATVLSGCSKDDDDDNPSETKTELLVKSSWKFDKAEAAPVGNISSYLEACLKDNLLSFSASSTTATSGAGVVDEGPTKCNEGDPQNGSFSWELINNGAVLRSSVILFDGGSTDFNVVTLNANSLVLSQQMALSGLPSTTVTVTFKH